VFYFIQTRTAPGRILQRLPDRIVITQGCKQGLPGRTRFFPAYFPQFAQEPSFRSIFLFLPKQRWGRVLRRLFVALAIPLICSSAEAQSQSDLPRQEAHIECPELHVTKSTFAPEIEDLSSFIQAEAGTNARQAEWSEIKSCFAKFGLNYFRRLGVKTQRIRDRPENDETQILVLVNGKRYFTPKTRAYFAAFHGGHLPRSFLPHDQVAGYQISLGSWFYPLRAFYVVEAKSGKALPIRKPSLPHDTDFAEVENRAKDLLNLGEYQEALRLYKQSAAILENYGTVDAPDLARLLTNMAFIHDHFGRHSEAEPLLKRALAIREKALGPDHPATALILGNLAGVYAELGRHRASIRRYCVPIRRVAHAEIRCYSLTLHWKPKSP
jgi:tetratricopeptide (TPR) repeat protein